jgi:hypothetical protein
MLLSLRPNVIAGVAIAGAGLIAATPVTPPLPGVYVSASAVQLTAAETFDLLDPVAALGGTGDSAQSSIDSGIQTALINAIMAAETATNNGLATLSSALATPIDNLGTGLTNFGTMVSDLGGAFGPIGDIVGNYGSAASLLGELVGLFGGIAPQLTQPVFDIQEQLVLLGSALLGGGSAAAASDLAAGLPDVSALSGVSALVDPSTGPASVDSAIQTALINAIDTASTDFGNFTSMLEDNLITIGGNIATALTNTATMISDMGGAFVPLGAIVGDVGTIADNTFALLGIGSFVVNQLADDLVFNNSVDLVQLGSALIPGGDAASSAAAGLPDLVAGLEADLSALDPGLAADLGGLLGAVPADLASLPTDLLTIF